MNRIVPVQVSVQRTPSETQQVMISPDSYRDTKAGTKTMFLVFLSLREETIYTNSSFSCLACSSINLLWISNGTGAYSKKVFLNFALPCVIDRSDDE